MNLIHSTADRVALALDPGHLAKRDELLRAACLTCRVRDANEQESAVAVGRLLRGCLAAAEESRVEVKAPVLALAKQIDALAKSFCAPIELEAKRLGRLVADFQNAEALRVAEEKRLRDLEVAEAERYRLECEANAAAQAAQMQDEAGLKRAIDAEEAAREADELSRAAIVAPLPSVDKARGAMVKRVPVVTVTDIHSLYAHNRALVTLELNKRELNAVIYEGCTVPGLKITWETQASFRA